MTINTIFSLIDFYLEKNYYFKNHNDKNINAFFPQDC